MKELLVIVGLFLCSLTINAQSFKLSGNNYTSTATSSKSSKEKTKFTWTDSKGNTYPIYIGKSGSCFVIKKSKKTGDEYPDYRLEGNGKDISADICKKLGRTYSPKTKRTNIELPKNDFRGKRKSSR